MRKYNKLFVVLVIVFSMLSSNVFVANAATVDLDEYDSCSDYFFANFKENNVPYNYMDNCGYVAMFMLLSYYDMYWNDNFVPDKYEQNVIYDPDDDNFSLGILKTENELLSQMHDEYQKAGGTLEEREYIESIYTEFVQDNQDNGFLHIDLIGLGIDRGYYDGLLRIEEYLISIYDMVYVLDDYLDEALGDDQYYYIIDQNIPDNQAVTIKMLFSDNIGTTYDDVVDKMHELSEQSIPYIYTGVKSSGGRHFLIGYDTEKEGEEIKDYKLHEGYRFNFQTTFDDTEYDSNIGIVWLEINEELMPHVCSPNYVVDSGSIACSCGVYRELHPEHVHEYSLESTTETTHTYTCAWGCEKTEHHDRSNCYSISNVMHTATCSCGRTYSEQHNFEKKSARYSVCMNCGYTRDHFGGNENVHLGTKEDEETE